MPDIIHSKTFISIHRWIHFFQSIHQIHFQCSSFNQKNTFSWLQLIGLKEQQQHQRQRQQQQRQQQQQQQQQQQEQIFE